MSKALLSYLSGFVSEHKRELFDRLIHNRTRYLTVAVENVFQPHNASAVLRSCDCFGIQDVHIIENNNPYTLNPGVSLGASKWLNLHRYHQKEHNTLDCIRVLRRKGYQIVATTPHTNDSLLPEFELNQPTALLFGTEMQGLSPIALEEADAYIKIPMYGFTESFNISVSAALTLYELTQKLRTSELPWQLSEKAKTEIQLSWVRQVVKSAGLIEKDFLKKKETKNASGE